MPINRTFDFGEELRRAASDIHATQSVGAHAILAEEPVPLSVFVQDRKFLANPPLSEIQYEAVRHIERIYYQDTYQLLAEEFEAGKREGRLHIAASNAAWREEKYWSAPIRMCNFINIQWGKGSGKDHVVRIASMRIAYLLLCLNSPQKYFGMPEQDTIHLLNVASNSAQAQQAFFTPIVRAVKKGWFSDKCVARVNLISYAKNIESISGHSDAESQEGLNLMLGIADEIDAFKSKKELSWRKPTSSREPTKSAEGILNMMRTSSSTRFPEIFKNVRISYPRYLGSTIQQLTQQSREDNKERGLKSRHYVSGPLATWEVNPRVPGREAFAEDYREDPVMARAKYECRPDRAINPYFRNVMAVDAAFELVDREPLTVSYRIEEAATSKRRVWVPVYGFSDKLVPIRGARYTIHADLAANGDRAGLCMAHVADYQEFDAVTEDEDGAAYTVRETRPKIKVDFCIGFSADISLDPPREIQIRWARQLCFELIKRGFAISMLTFDFFQSLDSMQILEARGIETERISTNISDEPWRNLRDLIYEGRLTIPRLSVENMAAKNTPFLLRDELLALSKMPNGKIDHPADGCFTGETRIPLLDGTVPEIRDLVDKEVWVYSARSDGSIVPGKARGRWTKDVTDLVDVVLDNGYVARCTPDHRWMLRDGTYKAAADLLPGIDRLMSINRVWPVNGGYERVTDAFGTRRLTHVLVAEYFAGRKVQPGEVVHHSNHVKTDNSPSNVGIMDWEEHRRHHANERWARDHGYVARMRAGHAAWLSSPEAAEALAKRDLSALSTPERRARLREMNRTKNPAFRHDITFESLRSVSQEKTANGAARRLNCGRNVIIARLRENGFDSWKEFQAACNSNHKVRYVIPVRLAQPVPVYDLEVKGWNNFALTGGVFVHNSKDLADALAVATMTAIKVGGREEGPGARRYYEPNTFTVGQRASLPFGLTSRQLADVWTTSLNPF